MKTKSILLTAAFLLCTYSIPTIAQDASSLIEKLEKATKEKEPQWKLDRKLPTEKLLVLRWSSGEERVFMSITMVDSPAQAKDIYDRSVARLDEDEGATATKSTVSNLGDENQFWTLDTGSARMQFRQHKVHVLLFAPSRQVAERFARYVGDLLPQSKSAAADNPQPWKNYSSSEGGFSILFPGIPTQDRQVLDVAPGTQFTLRIHRVKDDLAEYSVMYADYPIPVGDPAVARSVLDNGAKGAVESVNAELLQLKEITFDGHPGRYLKEKMPRGEIMRVKMLLVGQRLYQVAITTPREEGASAERIKEYQTMADRFLDSFKLIKR